MTAKRSLDRGEQDWPAWAHDDGVQRAGGLTDPGYLDEYGRQSCGMVRAIYRDALSALEAQDYSDQLENMSLLFLSGAHANAYAMRRSERRAIGFQKTLIDQVWALWHGAIASKGLLDGLFDSEAPKPENAFLLRDLNHPRLISLLPKDWPNDRAMAHRDLFFRSIEFLVFHEIAHHVRGHLDIIQTMTGNTVIDEALNARSADQRSRKIQMLEFDADHHGLDILLIANDASTPISHLSSQASKTEFFRRGLSILAVFQQFDLAHRPMFVHDASSHPAPVHRAMRVLHALSRIFSRLFDWSEEERLEEHDLVWEVASDLAFKLGMPEGRWRGKSTAGMLHERYLESEAEFFDFSRWLDAENAK